MTTPTKVAGGLDPAALVAGAYDTRMFKLAPKTKLMFAGGIRKREVRVDTEKVIVLPNGHKVRVHTDAGQYATHIEESDGRVHAVARPDAYRMTIAGKSGEPIDGAARRRLWRAR